LIVEDLVHENLMAGCSSFIQQPPITHPAYSAIFLPLSTSVRSTIGENGQAMLLNMIWMEILRFSVEMRDGRGIQTSTGSWALHMSPVLSA
jgi:hypothetical protein